MLPYQQSCPYPTGVKSLQTKREYCTFHLSFVGSSCEFEIKFLLQVMFHVARYTLIRDML